jgi:hypothetical protein
MPDLRALSSVAGARSTGFGHRSQENWVLTLDLWALGHARVYSHVSGLDPTHKQGKPITWCPYVARGSGSVPRASQPQCHVDAQVWPNTQAGQPKRQVFPLGGASLAHVQGKPALALGVHIQGLQPHQNLSWPFSPQPSFQCQMHPGKKTTSPLPCCPCNSLCQGLV